ISVIVSDLKGIIFLFEAMNDSWQTKFDFVNEQQLLRNWSSLSCHPHQSLLMANHISEFFLL
ncbi:MAG: hypothetical protein ACKO96_01800, partial [Flammeovirgaceae bacterium]